MNQMASIDFVLCTIPVLADWWLTVDGLVARPSTLSLEEIAKNQITHQACEQGWSFIAEMDGRAAILRDEFGGSFGEGEICGVLAVRRVLGQPGLAGCVSCSDIFGLQLEWREFARGSWSAFAGAGGAAVGI